MMKDMTTNKTLHNNSNTINPFLSDYSVQNWNRIEAELDRALRKSSGPHYAAFDADGTLWDFDLGEVFFHWQIKNCGLPLPAKPWEHYLEMKKINNDPRQAFVWLAAINKGKQISQVRYWAKKCVEENSPLPIFKGQKKLIELLQTKGVEVFVVTASVGWAVEPGAEIFGIKKENVLGVHTLVEQDLVTDRPPEIVTWKAGKAKALLTATKGVRPVLSCGNTMGDLDLIDSSMGVKIAVRANGEGSDLFETENQLHQIGLNNNWVVQEWKNLSQQSF